MPVPKRKLSRARIRSRQANKGIKPKAFTTCKNCQSTVSPHQVCETCGFYKGRKIFQTKMDRALKRGEARQAKQKLMEAKTEKSEESKEE